MKIYTKTGDKGQTSLLGGTRVGKDHIKIEAYGTVDELNSFIGVLISNKISSEISDFLGRLQPDLFTLGSHLAADQEKLRMKLPHLPAERIIEMEEFIDLLNNRLSPLKSFVLPSGNEAASMAHVCRCVCRRAERHAVGLAKLEEINPDIITYLNRLSDLLFVIARSILHEAHIKDVPWLPPKE